LVAAAPQVKIAQSNDIEDVAGLLREMMSDGRADDAIELVVELLTQLRSKNTELEFRLFKLLKERFGKKGEGVSSAQLSLFIEKLKEQGESLPSEDDADDETDEDAEQDENEEKRKGPGRNKLPKDLPRETEWAPVPYEERVCPQCGDERRTIGHESSEVLELVPAHFKVIEVQREKMACKRCEEEGVVTAPAPQKVFPKGLPGPGLVTELLINKYQDHLPLYRQSQRFGRLGVRLARSTLSDWVGAGALLLLPVAQALKRLTLTAYLLQTDSTHIKALDRAHEANIRRGALWCYVGDGKHVVFDFTNDEKKEGPHDFMAGRKGYIQCDAASVYDGLFFEGSLAIEVGCWMHARRKFAEALDAGDLRAAFAVNIIKRMYKAERKLKKRGASLDEIAARRDEYTRPLLMELKEWIAERYEMEPPTQPLAKAMGYAIRQWKALTRFLNDSRLGPDNGEPERRIRGIAVGRRNHLFVGSDSGGQRAAILYSVLGSCALNDVEPRAYLQDVIQKLSQGWPEDRIDELVPANWKRIHAKDVPQSH